MRGLILKTFATVAILATVASYDKITLKLDVKSKKGML